MSDDNREAVVRVVLEAMAPSVSPVAHDGGVGDCETPGDWHRVANDFQRAMFEERARAEKAEDDLIVRHEQLQEALDQLELFLQQLTGGIILSGSEAMPERWVREAPTHFEWPEHYEVGDSHWATVVIEPESFEPRELTEAESVELDESGLGIAVDRMWIRPGVWDPEQEPRP